jgi:hypothetical protein
MKKATKSKQKEFCSSKKTDVKAGKEEGLTHKVTQQEKHRGKTLKKQFWKVYWPKEGWRSIFKDKEHYSALCKALREFLCSVNTGIGVSSSKIS